MTQPTTPGAAPGSALPVRNWLRLEGAAAFALTGAAYAFHGAGWWLFALLFLVPDLSMLGYLRDRRTGALIYNAFHTYVAPALTGLVGVLLENDLVLAVAIIWLAHIGFDRMLGYGLKLPSGFADTHLGRIAVVKKASS